MEAMTKWVRVGSVADVPEDGMGHSVTIDGQDIALFQWDQTFYALENLCPHLGFPLTEGIAQDGNIICGWHGWRIRLEDGSCQGKTLTAPTFPCEVRGDDLYLKIPVLP
jgi:nitrite reductase (NADH) small subunit